MVRIGDPGDARGRSGDRGNQAPKACQAIVASYDTGCAAVSTSGVDRRPVQRLLAEARPYRSHLVATSLLGLLATPLTLLVPLPLKIAIDSRLFRHIQRMSPAYHDSKGTADSIYRVQYDAPCIREILVDGLIPFISASL